MNAKSARQLTIVSNTIADDNQEIIQRAQIAKLSGSDFSLEECLNGMQASYLTTEQKKQIAALCNVSLSKVNSALMQRTAEQELLALLGEVPKNQFEFVDLQLKQWGTTLSYEGIYTIATSYVAALPGTTEIQTFDEASFNQLAESEQLAVKAADPKRLTLDQVFKKLYQASVLLKNRYSERDIELGLELWSEQAKRNIIANAIYDITQQSSNAQDAEAEWAKFIDATTLENTQETKTVLQHFIWQVKRKMIDAPEFPVADHIMPVLYGEQGIGKSTWMQLFTQPIAEFRASTDFKALGDERNHELWSKYVLIFDEMAESARASIEDIKRKITESSFCGRKMKTNNTTLIINKSTLLGASNKDISRLIVDDTGMRRFFQIYYKKPTQDEWEILNAIDYRLLWNSVDYKQSSPLRANPEIFESIAAIQASKRHIGCVELFLMDRYHNRAEDEITGTKLYEEFKEFEQTQKAHNEQSQTAFAKELMDVHTKIPGLTITKKRKSSGFVYVITNTAMI